MKTQSFIVAMLFLGLTTFPISYNASNAMSKNHGVIVSQLEEKVKVDPADLPVPVKEAIEKDEKLRRMKISEAWKSLSEDEPKYFIIKFDRTGEEDVVRKYTSLGEEIED
jgi:hypothetical protein